jgi:hypothetical protein
MTTTNNNNEKFQFKGKITRAKFEDKMIELADGRDLSARKYNEMGVPLTLYYISHSHAATWQKSGGMIFNNETIDKHIADTEELTARRANSDK